MSSDETETPFADPATDKLEAVETIMDKWAEGELTSSEALAKIHEALAEAPQ